MEKEIWKDIEGYNGIYQVSNFGRIKSLDRISNDGKKIKGRILSLGRTVSGYPQACLCKNGEMKWVLAHRVVATAFIHNPNNLREINHMDERKDNNHVDNLEWCTRSYNNIYSDVYKKGQEAAMKSICKSVVQIKGNAVVRIFQSARDAERQTGIQHESISACCRGKRKTAGGYGWVFDDDTATSCMSFYGLCE